MATLSRKELCEMLMSLKEAEGMPPLPDEKAYFSALTDAWLEIQYGRDSSKDIPDAYK